MEERWHRHLGVYGICVREGMLLLIRKTRGLYVNQYDLPGGTVDPDETLADALRREFLEEAGMGIRMTRCLGVRDYVVPHESVTDGKTHLHHVAVFYEVECVDGAPTAGAMRGCGATTTPPVPGRWIRAA